LSNFKVLEKQTTYLRGNAMLPGKVTTFEAIDSRSWEHPADRAALAALKSIPGFDEFIKKILGIISDRKLELMFLANSIRVSETQYSKLWTIMNRLCTTFDWPVQPTVFVTQSPFLNGGTLGVDKPMIVINSSVLHMLDDDELTCLLAHELGHIMSGHAAYKTLLYLLLNITFNLLPVSQMLIVPIILALREWDRKSELSADRVEVLALQNPEPSYELLIKLAGGTKPGEVNINEFFKQAQEYEAASGLIDQVHKFTNLLDATHPFAVMRLKELHEWVQGGSYQSIIDGVYLRRGIHKADTGEELKGGFDFYKEETQKASPIIESAIEEIGDKLINFTVEIGNVLGSIFNPEKK